METFTKNVNMNIKKKNKLIKKYNNELQNQKK